MQGRVAPCNSTGRGHPRSQHKAVSDDTLLPPRPPTLSHLKPCFEFHHFALAFSVLASERPLHLNDLSVGSLRWKAPSVCVTRHHEPLPLLLAPPPSPLPDERPPQLSPVWLCTWLRHGVVTLRLTPPSAENQPIWVSSPHFSPKLLVPHFQPHAGH